MAICDVRVYALAAGCTCTCTNIQHDIAITGRIRMVCALWYSSPRVISRRVVTNYTRNPSDLSEGRTR